MALKKPSDFFREDNKSDDTIHELVKRPELQSFSEAFDVYKNNLSKLDNLADTINCVEDIKSEIQDFIKKEDLDNSMMAYTFLLEESINKLKDDVKSINKKDLLQIQGDVSGLTEQINEFVEIEVPKYKSVVVESELRSSNHLKEFKEKISNIIEGIEDSVEDFKKESVSQLKEETLSTLDEKINLVVENKNKDLEEEIETLKKESIAEYREFIVDNKLKSENNLNKFKETLDETISKIEIEIDGVRDNKDSLFKNLQKKIKEVKNLKKNIIEDLETSENYKNEVTKKVSGLEIEIVRNESHLKENNNYIEKIQGEVRSTLKRLNLDELERQNSKLTDKIKYLEEVFEKFSEKDILSEGILNITPETNNSDTLTPLNKNFVTLDQLQEHYRVFINRIQQQLSTLGGGGETQLQYLDDIVGIATNLSDYNGKFLKVDTSQPAGKNFVFATTAGGGYVLPTAAAGTLGGIKIGSGLSIDGDGVVTASSGGGSTGIGGTWAIDDVGINTTKNVGIGTTAKDGYSLYVQGDARITGILTVGEASITIDPSAKKLTGLDEIQIGSGTTAITIKKSESTGNIEFADEDGKEAPVGIGTTVNINTTGIITAANFSGIWSGTAIADGYIASAATWNAKQAALTFGIADTNAVKIDSSDVGDDEYARFTASGIEGRTSAELKSDLILVKGDVGLGNVDNVSINSWTGSSNITKVGTLSSLSVNGDVSIGGTLTYEDVTNIDSVGLITAREGIHVVSGAGVSIAAGGLNVTSGITTVGFLTATDVWVSGAVTTTSLHISDDEFTVPASGTITAKRNIAIQTVYPIIQLTDTDSNSDFQIQNANGKFGIRDTTNSKDRLVITSDGDVGIGTDNPTGAAAITNNEAVLAVGIVTANTVYGTTEIVAQRFSAHDPIGATNNQTRDKYRVWNASSYTIGMDNGFTFGALGGDGGGSDGYAMTFQMNDTATRGFWWGDSSQSDAQGAMSLNVTGELVVAKSIRVGGGESDLLVPRKPLDIVGDGIISGDVGIGTINPTGTAALTSNEKVLAVGVVTANTLYGKLNNLTYPTTNGTDGHVLTSDGAGVVQWEAAPGSGGGEANQNAFSNVAVAGQTTVAADSATDTLTLVAGTNVTITTDDSADSVTIAASGGGGGSGLWESNATGINTSTNVGIGTTTVSDATLVVDVGTASTAVVVQGSEGRLFSVTNSLSSGSIFSVNDISGIPSIDVDADGTIQLAPYSTTENIGVGITNPTSKLHVVGDIKITGVATATDFDATSDIRLKTNIQPIGDPLAKVIQIEGVSFNWKENNIPALGVIADQLEDILPELVRGDDPKTVNYNGLIGLLIEAVKEQQTQIDSLKERISKLE